MVLTPPPMAPRRMPVVMAIVVVRMPVAVGVVPGVRRGDAGHTDDCDDGERERECPQEMRTKPRIARRSGRHTTPPFLKGSSIGTTVPALPHIHGDYGVLTERNRVGASRLDASQSDPAGWSCLARRDEAPDPAFPTMRKMAS